MYKCIYAVHVVSFIKPELYILELCRINFGYLGNRCFLHFILFFQFKNKHNQYWIEWRVNSHVHISHLTAFLRLRNTLCTQLSYCYLQSSFSPSQSSGIYSDLTADGAASLWLPRAMCQVWAASPGPAELHGAGSAGSGWGRSLSASGETPMDNGK